MPRITELCAWVGFEGDEENECVPAGKINYEGTPMAFPLIGADKKRMISIRRLAQDAADVSGQPLKLIRCSQVEILEWVHPKGTDK